MKRWFLNVLTAIDQLLNALICNGEPDETMSSAAYRMHRDGRPTGFLKTIIDTLFFFDPDHCKTSYWAEKKRSQLAPEFRNE
jgi:hypothetical protein